MLSEALLFLAPLHLFSYLIACARHGQSLQREGRGMEKEKEHSQYPVTKLLGISLHNCMGFSKAC